VREWFSEFARAVERGVSSPWAFLAACALIVAWGSCGPLFGWSDTHQLVINTVTTVITFLMVFLIQHTQSRDTKAIHLKLDELIRVNEQARNILMQAEDMKDSDLAAAKAEIQDAIISQ
jgi:low affinity Fe/Cu permease